MHDMSVIVAIVIGFPIAGATAISVAAIMRGWWLKARELKIREQQVSVEEKLRTDELNAKILRMDDAGVSASEIAALSEEVRRLRQEVAEIRQEMISRGTFQR